MRPARLAEAALEHLVGAVEEQQLDRRAALAQLPQDLRELLEEAPSRTSITSAAAAIWSPLRWISS